MGGVGTFYWFEIFLLILILNSHFCTEPGKAFQFSVDLTAFDIDNVWSC